jgi:hypothetical protein
MSGIRIRHRTARSTIALVPLFFRPLVVRPDDICGGCKAAFGTETVHPVKTVHLWVDDSGACIVSEGVLEHLREAGMPDLEIVGDIANPPALEIGPKSPPREAQDQKARKLIIGRR